MNFPIEFAKLRNMTALRDRRVGDVARGKTVAARIDDSGTGPLPEIATNRPEPLTLTRPEESLAQFTQAEGSEANLFAWEREFPELGNPVQFAFDARGRLWICTLQTYPQYNPGTPVHDGPFRARDASHDADNHQVAKKMQAVDVRSRIRQNCKVLQNAFDIHAQNGFGILWYSCISGDGFGGTPGNADHPKQRPAAPA